MLHLVFHTHWIIHVKILIIWKAGFFVILNFHHFNVFSLKLLKNTFFLWATCLSHYFCCTAIFLHFIFCTHVMRYSHNIDLCLTGKMGIWKVHQNHFFQFQIDDKITSKKLETIYFISLVTWKSLYWYLLPYSTTISEKLSLAFLFTVEYFLIF